MQSSIDLYAQKVKTDRLLQLKERSKLFHPRAQRNVYYRRDARPQQR
jgi:hypothetical protein